MKLGVIIGQFAINGVTVRYVKYAAEYGGGGALCFLDQVDRDGNALKGPPGYAAVAADGAIWREGRADRPHSGLLLVSAVAGFTGWDGRIGEWHYRVRASRLGSPGDCAFIAWCARTAELGVGPIDIDPAETVFFSLGKTPEAVFAEILRDIMAVVR